MKKTVAMLLSMAMCLSLCIPAFAAGDETESSVTILEANDLDPEFSSSLLGEDADSDNEGALRSIVKTYDLDVPYAGVYYVLDTSLELTPGTVSFVGTWGPSYVNLVVEIISDDGSYGTMTTVSSSATGTLRIRYAGSYTIRVKAISTALNEGTINFTF